MCLTALQESVRARAAFILTVLVSAESAWSFALTPQERGVELLIAPPEPLPVVLPFDPSQSAGLFVGIRDFLPASRFPEVPYAVDDAIDLAFLFACELHLVKPQKVVLLLAGKPKKEESQKRQVKLEELGAKTLDANRSIILRVLEEQSKSTGPAGLWILTFSSHGVRDRIVAADAIEFSEPSLTATSIDAKTLFAWLDQTKAPRKIVLLDVCREAPRIGTRAGQDPHLFMSDALIRHITESKGEVILSAARRGGLAFDDKKLQNGVFSSAILDGLHCEAGHDENGYVTVSLLADFANQRVTSWVEANRPEYRDNSGIEKTISGSAESMALAQCPSPCEEIKPRLLVRSGRYDRTVSPGGTVSLTGLEVRSVQNLLIRADFPETPAPHSECVCRWEREQDREPGSDSKEPSKVWLPVEKAGGPPCSLSYLPPTPLQKVVLRLTVGKAVHPPFTIEVH